MATSTDVQLKQRATIESLKRYDSEKDAFFSVLFLPVISFSDITMALETKNEKFQIRVFTMKVTVNVVFFFKRMRRI